MRHDCERFGPVMTENHSRRDILAAVAGAAAALALPGAGDAKARVGFGQRVATFRARALARGISGETYDRVMGSIKPDTSVFDQISNQPEFTEETWQYVNRRVSDWRITVGKEKAKENAALLTRIEKDFGVEPAILLALWGVESGYGDPDVQKSHMRPVFPSLAALAC